MKRYITGSYGLIIEEVDFIKESEHTLWYKSKNGHNYNCRKNSTYAQVHETFDSAKSFLLKKESDRLYRLKSQLQSCVERIEEINLFTI